MYRNCIFCSSAFGSNECLEAFPVGRQIAFDAVRGRLWAVCAVCGRWNLAPIEERWETVEAAEKLYHDARMRVQRENIGLARLPDGTRLVRVGKPVEGELAAWRYGSQLLRRRRRYVVTSTGGLVLGAAAMGGLWGAGMLVGVAALFASMVEQRRGQRVMYRAPSHDDNEPVVVRRWHLSGMSLQRGTHGDIEVNILDGRAVKPEGRLSRRRIADSVVLSGAPAHALLGRAMVCINDQGATRATLEAANRHLLKAGSAERFIQTAAARNANLGAYTRAGKRDLKGPAALAFEMALHEESERRALEGELSALTAAWREAEEIAAIADTLPGEVLLNRMLTRMRV